MLEIESNTVIWSVYTCVCACLSAVTYEQRRIEQQASCHELQLKYSEVLQQCEKWILQTSLQLASLETASATTYESAVQQTNTLKV
jgi:hypothetical protein